MNIFVTSVSPRESAQYLDDMRVNKMILESAQILSTVVVRYLEPELYNQERDLNKARRELAAKHGIYTATHPFHPVVLWVGESSANFEWVLEHLCFLMVEYTKASGKVHKTQKDQILEKLSQFRHLLPKKDLTNFINYAKNESKGLDFTNIADTCVAYRTYLKERWAGDVRQPTWRNRVPQL